MIRWALVIGALMAGKLVNANANFSEPVDFSDLATDEARQACGVAIANANKNCFGDTDTLKAVNSKYTGILEATTKEACTSAAQSLIEGSNATQSLAGLSADLCAKGLTDSQSGCSFAKTTIEKRLAELQIEDPPNVEEIEKYQGDSKHLDRILVESKQVYGIRKTMFSVESGMASDSSKRSANVLGLCSSDRFSGSATPTAAKTNPTTSTSLLDKAANFIKEHPWTSVGGAGLLGFLGGKMLGGGSEDEKDSDSKSKSGAAGTCKPTSNSTACQNQFVGKCSTAATMDTAENCATFADHYCGLKDGKGPGNGSSFCQVVTVNRYCKNQANANCASCKLLKAPNCWSGMSACMNQISQSDMANYRSTCSTDPGYVYITTTSGTTSTIMAATPTTPTTTTTNPTQSAVNASSAAASSATTGSNFNFSVNNGAAQARQERMPADIGAYYGPSVFTSTSNTIGQLCTQGELNNCGPR
jgi:hypothetical protein